jgi:uncharacterized SAM-binding protein YcdF (DUF218 family)
MSAHPAQTVYDFLSLSDEPELRPADLIIGFGHFDLRIAQQCAALWQRKLSPRILFTGGVGAGSADLGQPEAEAFAAVLHEALPSVTREQLIVESRSTNTGDNVRFSMELIARADWDLQSAILVATPFRQRRVNLTWSRVTGGIPHQSAPPPSSLSADIAVFAQKNEDLIAQLPGEIERLRTYPQRGWIDATAIPDAVISAAGKIEI